MAPGVIKPKKLQPGATIGFIAPSSHCDREFLDAAKAELKKRGFESIVHPQCLLRDKSSAGSAEEKVLALHDVFRDPAIDAVWCFRGGYRALHMLDKIDYDLIHSNPKIFIGYSDITSLHNALHHRSGLVTFHGPTANTLGSLGDPALSAERQTFDHALAFLCGDVPDNLFYDHPARIFKPGMAEGSLIGGNLQLMSMLLQADDRYCPDLDGAILMIEDIGEEIAKLDSQLGAWRLRGIFDRIAGLVVGNITNVKDTPGSAGHFIYTIEDIIRQHTAEMTGPVVFEAPFGHTHPNAVFPVGIKARLTAENGKAALSLLESAFGA